MSERPKQRSSIARRAFLAALIGQLMLLVGLGALLYWAYLTLDTLLPALLGAPSWIGIQNVAVGLSLDLAPYAGGLLAVMLVLIWLLARWVARPLSQLVAAALALGSDGAEDHGRPPGSEAQPRPVCLTSRERRRFATGPGIVHDSSREDTLHDKR